MALGKTVAEIERTMTAQELRRWRIFSLRHPLPADLLDVHLSQLASIVCNIARGDGPPFTADQFYIIRNVPTPEEKHEELRPRMSEAERVRAALQR